MPAIEWISTIDNRDFVQKARQMQEAMKQTSNVLKSMEKGFDIDGIVNQYVSLTKVIQGNEAAIRKAREEVLKWKEDLASAVSNNDMNLADTIQGDITSRLNEIEKMSQKAEEAKQSINTLLGLWDNLEGKKAPMLFNSQEEYEHVRELKAKIAELQTQITDYNGSDSGLEVLRGKLSETEEELRRCEQAAASNAAALGSAGRMAADASNHYYEFADKIKEQSALVGELTIKLNEAKKEKEQALLGGNTKDISDARVKVDALSTALDNAKQSLSAMQIEQDGFHKKMQQMSRGVTDAGSEIIGVFKNIAAVAGVSFTLGQAKQFVNELVSIRAAMQDLETSTKVFLGSQEAANDFNEKLRDYSTKSLFHYNELMAVSHQMLALGMNTDDAMRKIDQLANIAAATHASLSTVVSMYTRAQTMGSVMNRQLVSWQNMGVNVKGVLKEMGDEATKSSISFEQLDKVINQITAPGGKFANTQQEMLGNISAEIDTYKNKMELMFNEIGVEYQDYIVGAIKVGQNLVDNYREIGTFIMDVVAAYGAYRAALIAVSAAHKLNAFWENASLVATKINTAAKTGQATAVTTSTVAWRLATASLKENTAALVRNSAAALTNPYVLLGAAVAALTYGVYKLATADDAETAARKRANEANKEFADQLKDRADKVNEYVSVLHDANATEMQKAEAWDNLKNVAPSLVEGYTMAEFAAKSLDETQKELNKDTDDIKYNKAVEEVDKWKKALEEAEKAQGDWGLVSKESKKEIQDFFGYGFLENAIPGIKERLKLAQEELDKLDELKAKVAEPKNINDMDMKELLSLYDSVPEKIDEINEKEILPQCDVENIKSAIGDASELRNKLMEINIYEAAPDVDIAKLDAAREEAVKAIDELKNLDNEVADPDVKKEKIEEAEHKVRRAIDKLNELGALKASPEISLTGFEKTLSQLKQVWGYVRKLMGYKENEPSVTKNGEGNNATKADVLSALKERARDAKNDEEVNARIKELNEYISKAEYGSTGRKEAQKLLKELQKKKKDNADSGQSGSKTAKEQSDRNAKTIQEQRKYEEQMTELTKKAQRAREDAAIAAIQNDGERERKEREVQHQRTIEDLQKQSEEIYKTIYNQRKSAYETANKDKKYENTAEGQAGYSSDEARQAMKASFTEDEKKQFDTNQAYYRAETDKTNSEYARATLERQKSEIQAMQEYLKQYGDYEQKRLAITKEYEEKIRNAKTEGEKLSLQKEQENALSNINFEQIKQSMNWEEIFSNLANYESQYLAHLREELRDALNVSDITAENARIITDKINEISALIEQKKNALGKLFGQGGIMSGSWLGSVFETKSNLSQLESKAQTDRQKADSANTAANVAKFNKQYLDSSLLNALKEKGYNFQNVSDEGVMGAAQSAGLIEQYNEAIQAGTKATEAATAASSASATAGSSAMAAMGSKAAGSFAIVDAIIHGVNDNLQSANKAVQEWGIGGKDFQEKFSTFAESSQYATDAFDSLKKGDIAGVVYNLGNAFSTLGESVGLWSNSNISDKIAEFNEMANALNVNTQALNKLTAKIGEGDAVNAFRNYEQAKEQMKANESITADMLYNLVKRYDGHHSTDYNFYDDYNGKNIISRINRILGTKFENLYDIFHGDATILNRLYDTEEGRQVLTDFTNALRLAEEDAEMTGNDIVGNFISMLNDYSSDAYDELHKSFQEAVTGISFDSFKDGFKSMLMDMDSDVDDFKDDFTKKLMQSVLNAHIEKLFGSQLSDLYDKWTNALDDNNLTQQEVEELQSVQDDLVAQMIAERDMLAKVTGYDTTTSQDQSAASKAADKVTYDQMDEFTGILRAIQIAGEHRSDNSDIILNTLLTMQTISTGCLSSVNDIKLLVGTSNDYLLDIKRSNRQILESMNDRIDKITNIIDTKL